MATELPSKPRELEGLARDQQPADCVVEGIPLSTLNVTAAVTFGLRVGLDAITQVLRGGSGPLGERRDEGKR